jgi:hypothetical protein
LAGFQVTLVGRFWVTAEEQVGKGQPPLTKADEEMIVDKAYNRHATTEARSYVHTALAALESGNPQIAIQQLKGYAAAYKERHVANPPTGSQVEKDLAAEIQAAYRNLPKPLRDQLQKALDEAKTTSKDVWISQIKLGR